MGTQLQLTPSPACHPRSQLAPCCPPGMQSCPARCGGSRRVAQHQQLGLPGHHPNPPCTRVCTASVAPLQIPPPPWPRLPTPNRCSPSPGAQPSVRRPRRIHALRTLAGAQPSPTWLLSSSTPDRCWLISLAIASRRVRMRSHTSLRTKGRSTPHSQEQGQRRHWHGSGIALHCSDNGPIAGCCWQAWRCPAAHPLGAAPCRLTSVHNS